MRAPGERTDDVVVHRGLSYSSTGWSAHRLDVWVPRGDAHVGARPMAMVFHGGGFTTLSKDTHWMFARALARRGLVVFNVNYRLAPEAPFPAAIEDACLATSWALEHAERYGADPSRLVLAGESAGANLAVATALATCAPRAELWARRLYERGVTPLAVVSMSGLLQVSDPGRFRRRDGALPWVVEAAIRDACEAYLPPGLEVAGGDCALADPLSMLEEGRPWSRPLPSFFAAAGSRDPILDDTRRLASALQAHGARHEVHVHAGQGHSFMAMMWRAEAQRFWARLFAFLDRELHAVSEARRRQVRVVKRA